MKGNKFVIIFLILSLFPWLGFGQTKVSYKVHYSGDFEEKGLRVQTEFISKKASDSTYFHFSNDVWGQTNLMNCLQFDPNENPNYHFRIDKDSNRIIVHHPKGKKINFSYRIKQDFIDNDPKSLNRPLVKNNYFHILGQSLFAVPEAVFDGGQEDPAISARIEWLNFPESFKIHNTFGSQQKVQTLSVLLWHELYHSVFVGGDYRIHSFHYENKPVHFAVRGNWLGEYNDEVLFESLKRTISSQRAFWNDTKIEYFTVILSPTFTQNDSLYRGQSITGSAVKNGFLIQSSNNPFNSLYTMKYIFNHEMMHDWIGLKISMQNEELNYWFSEGFTDYYAYKNRLRSGEITVKEWLEEFNSDVLLAHWENPERNKPNYVVKDSFWMSRDIEKIPYRRGAIFAFWLDNQILLHSNYTKSLDDLMREILTICVKEKRRFTDALLLDLANKYLNRSIDYFFQKHILDGVDFELNQNEFIPGFTIEKKKDVPVISCDESILKQYLLR